MFVSQVLLLVPLKSNGHVNMLTFSMTGAQTVLLIIALEHVMLLLKLIISAAIPDIPQHVAKELAKVEYARREVERLISKERVVELQSCARMDSKDSLSPPNTETDKETQCDLLR